MGYKLGHAGNIQYNLWVGVGPALVKCFVGKFLFYSLIVLTLNPLWCILIFVVLYCTLSRKVPNAQHKKTLPSAKLGCAHG